MKFLFESIREAFAQSPPAPPLGNDITPEENKERDEAIVRQVVRDRASGNVFLQRGKYVTEEDLNKRRERILAEQWDDE